MRILVVENGGPSPSVAAAWGSFTQWFTARIPAGVHVDSHDARIPLPTPEALPWHGVILSGSVHDVGDGLEWTRAIGPWALAVAERHPVLAVCFGHQLVAEALGSAVGPMAAGPERGAIGVHLTAAGRQDPLFAGLPALVRVHSSHRDEVRELPVGARLLGGTDHSPIQAFAWGPRLRAVQFHPEFAPGPMAAILDSYGASGPHRPSVWDNDHGQQILRNWIDAWVRPAAPGVEGAG